MPEREAGVHWASVVIAIDNHSALNCLGLINLCGNNDAPKQLVSFTPIALGAIVAVKVYTRTKQIDLEIEVTQGIQIDNSTGSFYLYPVKNSTVKTLKQSNSSVTKKLIAK